MIFLSFKENEKPAGALEIIVKNAHVELIMHPRLIDLVNKKWERFARRIFFHRFLLTLSYLLIFLVTTILDQTRTEIVRAIVRMHVNKSDEFFISYRPKVKVKMKLLQKSKHQA